MKRRYLIAPVAVHCMPAPRNVAAWWTWAEHPHAPPDVAACLRARVAEMLTEPAYGGFYRGNVGLPWGRAAKIQTVEATDMASLSRRLLRSGWRDLGEVYLGDGSIWDGIDPRRTVAWDGAADGPAEQRRQEIAWNAWTII